MSLVIGFSNLTLSIFKYMFSNLTLGKSKWNPVLLLSKIP